MSPGPERTTFGRPLQMIEKALRISRIESSNKLDRATWRNFAIILKEAESREAISAAGVKEAVAMKSKSDPGPKSRKKEAVEAEPRRQTADFSRLLAVEDVPETGLEVSLRADEAECAAIARSDGLVAVANLEADLEVTKQPGTRFNVSGVLRARVVQTCVVSLDPFETEVRADIDVDFAPAAAAVKASRAAGADIDVDGRSAEFFGVKRDPPDPIVDGRIDLGALVNEFLILSLDPYPRKPGTSFSETGISGDPVEKISPFTVLKKLKGES